MPGAKRPSGLSNGWSASAGRAPRVLGVDGLLLQGAHGPREAQLLAWQERMIQLPSTSGKAATMTVGQRLAAMHLLEDR